MIAWVYIKSESAGRDAESGGGGEAGEPRAEGGPAEEKTS